MEKEIWKDIIWYEWLYQISNLGNVKNFKKNIFLKKSINENWYFNIILRKKHFLVHRLVALTFLENPCCLPIVNHKDLNKQNNKLDNLEWCNNSYNVKYGSINRKTTSKKTLVQTDKKWNIINEFKSLRQAERELNINRTCIKKCCLKLKKSVKWFCFYFIT